MRPFVVVVVVVVVDVVMLVAHFQRWLFHHDGQHL